MEISDGSDGVRVEVRNGIEVTSSDSFHDTILALHDCAMSDDPHRAAVGRIGKHVLQAFQAAMVAEMARGTGNDITTRAVVDIIVTLIVNQAANVARDGHAPIVAGLMVETIGKCVAAAGNSIRPPHDDAAAG